MNATRFIILVSIGICSCRYQDKTQLNRVLIESIESIQYSNNQLYIATKERSYELQFEVESLQRNEQQQNGYLKLNDIYKRYLHIDSICDLELLRLDTLKFHLLHAYEINKSVLASNCFPQSIDFAQLTQVQLEQQVGDFFLDEENRGKKVYLNLKSFRSQLTNVLGSYKRNEKVFSVDLKPINRFDSKKEVRSLVEKMVDESRANLNKDRQVLIDVYIGLSYPEEMGDLAWEQVYFDNSSLLSALTVITNLQTDILKAKQLAVSHFLAFGCMASYPFNEVLPIAVGPLSASEDDTIELKVTMGAFDTYNSPIVRLNNRTGHVYYPGDGTGRVRLKLTKGIHQVRGTVSVQNRAGAYKTEDWEYQINVPD